MFVSVWRSAWLRFIGVVLGLILVPFVLSAGDRFRGFVSAIDLERQRLSIPGCSLAVGYGDGSIETAGVGFADLEQGIAATADTQYHIASLTKSFTAVLALQLEAEGQLVFSMTPSDPLNFPDPAVTVGHILSHTADGPDAGFWYRSDHYARLTPVLEAAARQTWPEMLERRIFLPLGMKRTSPGREYFSTQYRITSLARPYRMTGAGIKMAPMPSPECNGAYGIVSTVRDLVVWSQALDSEKLIKASQAERLFTPKKIRTGNLAPYGLGWFVNQVAGETIHWHYGWRVPGYGALILRVPSRGLTCVILANSDRLVSAATFAYANPLRSIFVIEFLRRYLLPLPGRGGYPPIDPAWSDRQIRTHLAGWHDGGRHLYGEELMARSLIASQCGDWKTGLRLMQHAVRLFPSSQGFLDQGTLQTLFAQRGEPYHGAASRLGRQLLRLHPAEPRILHEVAVRAQRANLPADERDDLDLNLIRAATGLKWIREAALARIFAAPDRDPRLLWRALVAFGDQSKLSSEFRKKHAVLLDALKRHAFWLHPLSISCW